MTRTSVSPAANSSSPSERNWTTSTGRRQYSVLWWKASIHWRRSILHSSMTQVEDLELIFSRFGKILSCEVIRDKRTGDSLQYAFIEFEEQKDCEQAYFKMQNVLIDDHRIHVDFSQSVSKLSDTWRDATNSK